MVRLEPEIDVLKPIEALQHQTARNQKSHRDRDLRDDENIKPSASTHATAGSLVAFLKARHHVAVAGAYQRRNESEDYARQEC